MNLARNAVPTERGTLAIAQNANGSLKKVRMVSRRPQESNPVFLGSRGIGT